MEEDWESENFTIPELVIPTQEELKRLEEKRLVEESDNRIAIQLFNDDYNNDNINNKEKTIVANNQFIPIRNKKNTVSKQNENEDKLKEHSIKMKEQKIKQKKHYEIYGDAKIDSEYQEYEDKYY
jgi:hypothetical protein